MFLFFNTGKLEGEALITNYSHICSCENHMAKFLLGVDHIFLSFSYVGLHSIYFMPLFPVHSSIKTTVLWWKTPCCLLVSNRLLLKISFFLALHRRVFTKVKSRSAHMKSHKMAEAEKKLPTASIGFINPTPPSPMEDS